MTPPKNELGLRKLIAPTLIAALSAGAVIATHYTPSPSFCESATASKPKTPDFRGPLLCVSVPLEALASQRIDQLDSYYQTHAFVTEGYVQPLQTDNLGNNARRFALSTTKARIGNWVTIIDNNPEAGLPPGDNSLIAGARVEIAGKFTYIGEDGKPVLELLAVRRKPATPILA